MIETTQTSPSTPTLQSLYQSLDAQLMQSSFAASAAEAHGLVSGLACRDFSRPELEHKATLFGFTDQSQALFWSLLEMVDRDLRKTDFEFDLWLPEEANLDERTNALGQWCHGFTMALCHDNMAQLDLLNGEVRESFDDLVAIAGAVAESDDKEDEVAFIEVAEYVRITTQLIFEDLNPATASTEPQN